MTNENSPTSKRCNVCAAEKSTSEFHRDKTRSDGLDAKCRACKSEAYLANRDPALARARQHYAENREQKLAYARAYHVENRERILGRQRKWNAENVGWTRKYRRDNRHIYWESDHRDRVSAFGFEPSTRSFTEEELLAKWGHECFHCGGPYEELDHWPVAVALGGEHSLDNCRPSCRHCNRAHGAQIRMERQAVVPRSANYFASPREQVGLINDLDGQIGFTK